MKNPFKIQGKYDPEQSHNPSYKQTFLYWSNVEGWGDFASATTFYEDEIECISMPDGATRYAYFDEDGEITHTEKIDGSRDDFS